MSEKTVEKLWEANQKLVGQCDKLAQDLEDAAQAHGKLQRSHDELVQQLTILCAQTVYGHHGITRLQVMFALDQLKRSVELVATKPEMPGISRPTPEYVENMTRRAAL